MFYKLQHVVLQQFSNIVLIDICVQNPYFKTVASVIKKAPASLPVLIWFLLKAVFGYKESVVLETPVDNSFVQELSPEESSGILNSLNRGFVLLTTRFQVY